MRKNKMMRLASSLLVAVLLTTCVISGTFAKYVTSDSAKDTARVAKWGALITVSGSLFDDSYKNTIDSVETVTVEAFNKTGTADGDKVVAPGTSGGTLTFGLSGKPEVASKLTYGVASTEGETNDYSNIWLADGNYGVMVKANLRAGDPLNGYYQKGTGKYTMIADDSKYASGDYYEYKQIVDLKGTGDGAYDAGDGRNIDVGSSNYRYYPLVWKHKIGSADVATVHSLAELDTAVTGINNTNAVKFIAPNTDLSGVEAAKLNVTWEWPFEVKPTSATANKVVDGADTVLGDLIAMTVKGTDGTDAFAEIVKVEETTAEEVTTTATILTVAKGSETQSEVYFAKAGDATVACLTAAYNVTVTLEQVD